MQPREFLLPLLRDALGALGVPPGTPVVLDLPRKDHRGDISTGVAFRLATTLRSTPAGIAQRIVAAIRTDERSIELIEIAGGGFINFTLTPLFYQNHLEHLLAFPEEYGRSNGGAGTPVAVEYLSDEPSTNEDGSGYRGAVIADAIAGMLRWTGHTVTPGPLDGAHGDAGLHDDILGMPGIDRDRRTTEAPADVNATLAELTNRNGTTGKSGEIRLAIGENGAGAPLLTKHGEPTTLLCATARCHRLLRRGVTTIILVTDESGAGTTRAIMTALNILGHPPPSLRIVTHAGISFAHHPPETPNARPGLRAAIDAIGPQVARPFMLAGGIHNELRRDGDTRWDRTLRDPLYEIHYTHFTLGAMLRAAEHLVDERRADPIDPSASLAPLTNRWERELMRKLLLLPWTIERGARELEPRIALDYLRDVAGTTRRFYGNCRMVSEEPNLRDARLRLLAAARITLGNGMAALGIDPMDTI